MPHGSLAEIACHHSHPQRWSSEQHFSSQRTSFSSSDDAHTLLSRGCKGRSGKASYNHRSFNSFLTSFPADAFRRPTNSFPSQMQAPEGALREAPRRDPFVEVTSSLGTRSMPDPNADDVSDFVDNMIGDIDFSGSHGPHRPGVGRMSAGPLAEEGPIGSHERDLELPPRIPNRTRGTVDVQMDMPRPGKEGGGPGAAMLEYWSVEGPDGEGAQLLTDGEGHSVVKHTHRSTDNVSSHHEEPSHQRTGHRSNASASRSNAANSDHKEDVKQNHSRQDSRSEQSHDRQQEHEKSAQDEESHHGHGDKERNGAHQQQDSNNYQDARDEREDGEEKAGDRQDEETDNGRHPVIIINSDPKDQGIHPVALVGGLLAIFAQAYLWGNVFVTLFKPQPRTQENPGSGAPQGSTMDRPVAPEQLVPEARRIPPEPHRLVPDESSTASTSNPSELRGNADISQMSSPIAVPEQPSQSSSSNRFTGASGQPGGAVVWSQRSTSAS